MVAVDFLSQIFGNGKNLRMVLFHSMNAGLVVGTLRDFENTQTLLVVMKFILPFLYSEAVEMLKHLAHACKHKLLAPPHIPTSHPWKDQLKVTQIS